MDVLVLIMKGVVVKRILILPLIIFALVFGISAEENGFPTIAIMNVAATNTSEVKSQVIYEYIVDVINRADRFIVVERSALQAAIKEMEISASGLIDDSTAAQIGKLAGAELILISNLIVDDGITYLSTRIVSVETGQVSDTAMLQKETDEYIASLANRTISQLLGEPEEKQEAVEEKDNDTLVAEKVKEEPEKIEKSEEPKQEPLSDSVFNDSRLSFSIGAIGIIPVLDDAEIFDFGYGLVADFNYKILNFGKSSLLAGVGTGLFLDKASEEKGVIFPYNLLSIPLSINAKYKLTFGKLYLAVKIAAGGTFNMFMYTDIAPNEETTVMAINPAVFPGLSFGYNLNDKLGLALFCDWSMIFFTELPYTALNAGLAVDINL